MRLAGKLMVALFIGILLVFGARGYIGIERELRLSASDARDNQLVIGLALRAAVAKVWLTEGKEKALDVVEYANAEIEKVEIRWVSFEPNEPQPRLLPASALAPVRAGAELSFEGRDEDGLPRLETYVPLVGAAEPVPGALEISESLEPHYERLRTSVLQVVLTTAAMTAVAMIVAATAGVFLIGRPMRKLAQKAEAIAQGDLATPLVLTQKDEIGDLAREMNQMCERLLDAQRRVAEAAHARIEALEQLRHADRLSTVGVLASGVAHELGTPLNVVIGRARMITSGEAAGDECLDSARVIAEQGERMMRIIRQLLDFSRRGTLLKAPRDLRELASSAASLLGPIAAPKNAVIRLDLGLEPVTAEVDASQTQQVIMNLLLNALQATPASGGVVTVEVGYELESGPAGIAQKPFLRVRDEGEGITAEHRPYVFEPFFTTKDVGEGTGLGLSVAYGIMRDHGGAIVVESTAGGGACFLVRWPAARGLPGNAGGAGGGSGSGEEDPCPAGS